MILGERIKKVRKEMDLTQQEFCDRIGLKRNSISLVESGKRNISDQAIKSICREFNVSEEWLRTGAGEMFIPKADDALEALVRERGLSEGDRLLVEKFMNLKPAERQVVLDYVLSVAAEYSQAAAPPARPASIEGDAEAEALGERAKELTMRQYSLEEKPAAPASFAKESGAG